MSRVGTTVGALKSSAGGVYRRSQRRLAHLAFERGLNTTENTDISSGHLYLYRALRGSRVGPDDVFLDYGSGKGRVLLHACRRPFARVIGIELDPDDCAFARANLALAAAPIGCAQRRWRCFRWTPRAGPSPTTSTTSTCSTRSRARCSAPSLARLIESLERRPRPLTLIYANPECQRGSAGDGPLPARPPQSLATARQAETARRGLPGDRRGDVIEGQLITERAEVEALTEDWERLAVEASNAITTAAWTLAWLRHVAPRDPGAGGRRARLRRLIGSPRSSSRRCAAASPYTG